jgi:hypothetical protein
MKITFTKEESERYFHEALCNAVGTGYMNGYGLELTCDRSQYKNSKEHLERINADACYEDILMQVLRDGGELTFVDHEMDGEYTRSIRMEDVHERVAEMPLYHLLDMIKENGDASTADVLLQTVFFEKVIFG